MKKYHIPTLITLCLSLTTGTVFPQALNPFTQSGFSPLAENSITINKHDFKRPYQSNIGVTTTNDNQRNKVSGKIESNINHADSTIIYGMHYRTNDWQTTSDLSMSIYSFHAAPEITFKNEAGDFVFTEAPTTAFYAKGKYYTLKSEKMEVYDTTTWDLLETVQLSGFSPLQASTYDPITDKAYLISWGANYMKDISSMDLETYEIKTIAQTNKYPLTIVAHPNGNLYSITAGDNKMWAVDKNTAEFTEIATTDMKWQNGTCSHHSVVEWNTGKWYMSGLTTDFHTALYTINPTDGTSTKIVSYPSDERFCGIYIPYTEAEAPAAPTNIRYENGTLKFSAPDKTYSGNTLNNNLSVSIEIDGTSQESSVMSGDEFSMNLNLSGGSHEINIRLSNDKGESPLRRLYTFVGNDLPGAVENLNFELSDDKIATVTWDAPTKSQNGGPVNSENIRYKVIREPNNIIVSESQSETIFTETLSEARHKYYYRVISLLDGQAGDEASSNTIVSGSMYVPPFCETFDSSEDFSLYSVIDNNDDGFTWSHAAFPQNVWCQANIGSDDYLISPAVQLTTTQAYRISFDATGNDSRPTTFEVLLYDSKNIEGNCKKIGEVLVNDEISYEQVFMVSEIKEYYIAIHALGEYTSSSTIDNLAIDIDAEMTAPGGVTELIVTAGEKGTLTNTISFKTPTTTYSGEQLESIDKVTIYQKGEEPRLVKEFDAPETGEVLTFVDENVQQGNITYSIRAYNQYGQGEEVLSTNYVGLDFPRDIANCKAVMTEEGKASFSWENPGGTGENGGYINPEDIYYNIYRYDNESSSYIQIASNIDDTNYTDMSFTIPEEEQQTYVNYAITACNETGSSTGYNIGIVLGTPYDMPYKDSFVGAGLDNTPWTIISTSSLTQLWNVVSGKGTPITPYDNDGGMLQFSNSGTDPEESSIMGPRISLKNSKNPVLIFYMYHGTEAEEEDLTLTVKASVDDAPNVTIAEIEYNNGQFGWRRHAISLAAYKDAQNIEFTFYGYAADSSAPLTIDNITVKEYLDNDLAIYSYTAPKRINAGETGTISTTIINEGNLTTEDYKVILYNGDKIVMIQDNTDLDANETATFTFDIQPSLQEAGEYYDYSINVVMTGDENEDNNSNGSTIYVNGPKYPKVTDLTAAISEDGTVNLNWSEPDTEMPDAAFDDFESYEAFIIDNIGDYTTYDGDGCATLYFNSPVQTPNQWAPLAWQIWNWVDAQFDSWEICSPHSGEQALTTWGAVDNNTGEWQPNDNWFISPEIKGGSDLSFWAKEVNVSYGPEYFEVLYSTTTAEPNEFIRLDGEILTTAVWNEYVYTLPDDTKYFAIRHYTEIDGFVMMIDDLTYTPLYGSTTTMHLNGYNIYRDNELIAKNIKGNSFTDGRVSKGIHQYRISTVWEEGESMLSNTCEIEVPQDVSISSTKDTQPTVTAGQGFIKIKNCYSLLCRICTTDGYTIFSETTNSDNMVIEVEHGIYIVTVGEKSYKIVVR